MGECTPTAMTPSIFWIWTSKYIPFCPASYNPAVMRDYSRYTSFKGFYLNHVPFPISRHLSICTFVFRVAVADIETLPKCFFHCSNKLTSFQYWQALWLDKVPCVTPFSLDCKNGISERSFGIKGVAFSQNCNASVAGSPCASV